MPLDLRLELYSTLVTGKWKLKTSMASQEEPSGSCWLLDGSPSSCLELSTLGTTKCIQGRNNHIYCFIEFEVFFTFSGVDCSTDNMVQKMTFYLYGSKRVMWKTNKGEKYGIVQ